MKPSFCHLFRHFSVTMKPTHRCDCSPVQNQRYMNKISGPLLDRIDLQCEIMPLSFEEMSNATPGESSAQIRERVVAARQRQTQRYQNIPGIHCNAQMTEKLMEEYCQLDEASATFLKNAMERMQLSARAYSRILKVARTIADLEGTECIMLPHISEAVGYRNLDRSDWGER